MFRVRRTSRRTKSQLKCSPKDFSLAHLREGEKGVMTHVCGGLTATRRLAELGLTPGTEVKVLRKCSFHGPVEVKVRDVSLALGYGLALKVLVQPLKANSDEPPSG